MKKCMLYRIRQQQQGGFMALMTSIIVSFTALTLVVLSSTALLKGEINAQNDEDKIMSHGLAYSCLSNALLHLVMDSGYSVPNSGEVVSVGANFCTILAVVRGAVGDSAGSNLTLKVYATHGRAITNLQAYVKTSDTDMILNKYEEISKF